MLAMATKTKQLCDAFEKAGGILIAPSDDDLRTFMALREMRAQAGGRQDEFHAWLRAEKPLLKTDFFRKAGLGPSQDEVPTMPEETTPPPPPPIAVARAC